jgi:hypothetical protein
VPDKIIPGTIVPEPGAVVTVIAPPTIEAVNVTPLPAVIAPVNVAVLLLKLAIFVNPYKLPVLLVKKMSSPTCAPALLAFAVKGIKVEPAGIATGIDKIVVLLLANTILDPGAT